MLYLLLAALGLLAVSSKSVAKTKPLAKYWSRTYLVPSLQPHVFDTTESEPFAGAKKAMTMIAEAVMVHGAPVWTTADGRHVSFQPLTESKRMAAAGFILYNDGKTMFLRRGAS